MNYIMIVIMFGNFSVETYTVDFDSQLTCENAKTAIVEKYDKFDKRPGITPVIMCLRK
mgnify:FL=1|tara:strand:- start:650 stop:823 length:174 start_codon:yes stop_codon:yes gene_type:complete